MDRGGGVGFFFFKYHFSAIQRCEHSWAFLFFMISERLVGNIGQ